jgi:DNA-binding NarL/FixJ family response regulator
LGKCVGVDQKKGMVAIVRLLLADDHAGVLAELRLQLGRMFEIVGAVEDGGQAVESALRLDPDVLVLDISMPVMNGFQVAARLRDLKCRAKVVILTAYEDHEYIDAAFSSGASAYVTKRYFATDLVAAIREVLCGRTFISPSLRGLELVPRLTAVKSGARGDRVSAPLQRQEIEIVHRHRHEVAFYSDDMSLLVGFTQFVGTALKARNAVIVVATELHRSALLPRLQEHGVDIAAAIEQGRYLPLDVTETLSTFMVNDLPDPVRFLKVACDLIATATKAAKGEHLRVSACGECAPTLWAQGKADAAVQVEHLWDEIAKTYDVDILCGYLLNGLQREHESHIYERICAEHSVVCSD